MTKSVRNLLDEMFQEFGLTVRELEVVEALVEGHTNSKDLAKHFEISESTANNHIDNISKKTSLPGKTSILSFISRRLLQFIEGKGISPSPRTVLILDDEKELAEVLQTEFEARGYNTLTFSEINDSLFNALTPNIDLIVSDVVMPKMHGTAFLEKVKEKLGYVPATVFISAYDSVTPERMKELGVYTLLKKPFPLKSLIDTSEKAIASKTA